MLLIIHIQTLLKLKVNLPYHDLYFLTVKCLVSTLSSAWTIRKRGDTPVFRGSAVF